MKKENNYLIVVLIVVILGGIIFYFGGKATLERQTRIKQENLANCLLTKNIKLYGAANSLYTEQQKEAFGQAFSKINYIECIENNDWSNTCKKDSINAVPTWSFPKSIGIETRLLSCEDCAKKAKSIYCKDYCFEESNNGENFYVAGLMSLEDIDKFSNCNILK